MTKYRAVKTMIDNITFDSKREAARYCELKLLFRAGKIQQLELQPEYEIVIHKKYRADFRYYENGELIVEDVKGIRTREYISKRKAMREQHKIQIRET